MEKHLIKEIESICRRYNVEYYLKNNDYWGIPEAHEYEGKVAVDNFEESIDWDWVSKNYHVSQRFIYKYEDKLDMTYLKEKWSRFKIAVSCFMNTRRYLPPELK